MQNADSSRIKRPAADSSATRPSTPSGASRRIDCGVTPEDRPAHTHQERGDARHGYLTSRGMYADQVQAI